jgi:hypothetical protein
VIATAACPRCLWERTAAGGEAPVTVAVALRAHYEVWHPAYDPSPAVIGPVMPTPPARSRRRALAYSQGTPAAV